MMIPWKAMVWGAIVACAFSLAGCSDVLSYDSVMTKRSSFWTKYDCQVVIQTEFKGNAKDKDARVVVLAVPFSPSVLTALTRIEQLKEHWSSDVYMKHLEDQLAVIAGVLYERKSDQYFDARGNYYSKLTQLDRLVFMVEFRNKTWPCINPILAWTPMFEETLFSSLVDVPCYTPDITDLEGRIVLMNDKQQTLRPLSVYGRKNNMLTRDEDLIVIFPLKADSSSFFDGAQEVILSVTGFDKPIDLKYPIELLR